MPVFNGEAFIEGALTSLLGQTTGDFKLLISDNASTDGTEDICREFTRSDKRIRYQRNETNVGPYANFRQTVHDADTSHFMWAAHDDLWEPTFVAEMLDRYRKTPSLALVCCDYDTFYHSERRYDYELGTRPPLSANRTVFQNSASFIKLPHSSLFYGVYRRCFLLNSRTLRLPRWFDYSDIALLMEACLNGPVCFIPEILYHAGVKTVIREPITFSNRRRPGWKFEYSQYYRHACHLIWSAATLNVAKKLCLRQLLNQQVLDLMSWHEPLPSSARLAFSIHRRATRTLLALRRLVA